MTPTTSRWRGTRCGQGPLGSPCAACAVEGHAGWAWEREGGAAGGVTAPVRWGLCGGKTRASVLCSVSGGALRVPNGHQEANVRRRLLACLPSPAALRSTTSTSGCWQLRRLFCTRCKWGALRRPSAEGGGQSCAGADGGPRPLAVCELGTQTGVSGRRCRLPAVLRTAGCCWPDRGTALV